MTIMDQLELDLTAPADETGIERAERNAEPDWWAQGMEAIKRLAATGTPFDAYSLTQAGLPEPDHANRYGALFRAAVTAGLIVYVEHHRSRRPGRAGGVCALWVGK